jgi:hypothetical protein
MMSLLHRWRFLISDYQGIAQKQFLCQIRPAVENSVLALVFPVLSTVVSRLNHRREVCQPDSFGSQIWQLRPTEGEEFLDRLTS